jgi:hexosaminidase
LIGWDEILEGGLAPKAVVMSWRGEAGGIAAARQKHNVVMTPGDWVYLNYSQTQNEDSVTIGGYLPLEKVYSYKPVPDSLTKDQEKFILGAQGNLWTEYIGNERILEYMLFPRMSALSEVLWSQKKEPTAIGWQGFEKRLPSQFKRYALWRANYSKAYFGLKSTILPGKKNSELVWRLESKMQNMAVDVSRAVEAGNDGQVNIAKGQLPLDVAIHTSAVYTACMVSESSNCLIQKFFINKATGTRITITTPPAPNYPGDGAFTLVNGVQNEKGLLRSREFLGFSGTDCEALIDLGRAQQINNVKAHVFEQTPSWIYRPKFFQVLISPDNNIYTEMGITDVVQFNDATNRNAVMTVQQKSVAARYIKVKLGNYGIVPEGSPGAGNKTWLFVDEIEVN